MKLVSGQSVDLPEQAPLQDFSGHKLDEIPMLQMVPRELNRVERPAHAGEAAFEEALRRGNPVRGERQVVPENLARPGVLEPVLLVEGESGRALKRLLRKAVGEVSGNEVGARRRLVAVA